MGPRHKGLFPRYGRAGDPGPGQGQATVFERPVPASGTSGEGKIGVQLLVVYYQRQQLEQRVEREFQQRQREQ
jgi:hypothetical protein